MNFIKISAIYTWLIVIDIVIYKIYHTPLAFLAIGFIFGLWAALAIIQNHD